MNVVQSKYLVKHYISMFFKSDYKNLFFIPYAYKILNDQAQSIK